ncbi:VOC family protein [Phytopseudomonas dryadis]|uniref:Glyoxalase n=1 Tax=Phytopseudomonas dryadis TaxID=2487520 RepID=A0ABY1Z365_9GAMM|nr:MULTISPECIES: VOC family protein [Pseudomonas]TBV02594.1 glyoxalase [Pseudomonas dryadis]TBV15446.1 glyoxalase [Pseudomonas sp. FRB 230]
MQPLLNIDVADLTVAADFYSRAFGLKVARRLFGGQVLELLGAQVPIYLLQQAAGSPPFAGSSQGRDYRRHWTPQHLDWVVDDLPASLRRVLDAGARQEGEVREAQWGSLALLSDPFGHGFCLIQWRGEGYASVAEPVDATGGQL